MRGCSAATGEEGSVGTGGGIEGWGCKVGGVCCCCWGGNRGTLKIPPGGFAGEEAGAVDGDEKTFVEKIEEGFSSPTGCTGGGTDEKPVDGVDKLIEGGTNVVA